MIDNKAVETPSQYNGAPPPSYAPPAPAVGYPGPQHNPSNYSGQQQGFQGPQQSFQQPQNFQQQPPFQPPFQPSQSYQPSPGGVRSPGQVGEDYRAQLYARCAQGIHEPTTKYGVCGIITAVVCFPIGLICLFTDTEQRCDRCGVLL